MALIHHPDRVPTDEKSIAKEKFSIVHQAYLVLSNVQEKQKYDNGSDILFAQATRSAEWEHFLKPANDNDMDNARKKYQNSSEERRDIELQFRAGNGSMTHIMNNIPFMRLEDEPRIIEIIKKLITDGKIPKQKIKKIARK